MRVVVIGGGLMGAAAAFFLAKRGAETLLIERQRVGQGATIASFGNIRRQGRYLPQLPLAHRSRALWGDMARLLGQDVEFRADGHVRFAFDRDAVGDMERFAEAAAPWGLSLELMGVNQLRARFPWSSPEAIAASYSPEDGSANPRLIAPALARAAARLGAEIQENTLVQAVRTASTGVCVETETGAVYADAALIAAGAWGARLSAQLGEAVPLEAMGPQMGVTEPLPHRIAPVVGVWARDKEDGVYFRQVERGNIVFGGGRRVSVALDPGHATVDPANTLVQLPKLVRLCPALAATHVIRTWSGCEGYVSDMLPVIGPSGVTPGVYYAFGFCGHGFQLGPGVGEVMAELIMTGQTQTPIDAFSITRFRERDRDVSEVGHRAP